MQRVRAVEMPPQCGLRSHLADANFSDAFAVDLTHSDRSALDIYLLTVARTPYWVRRAVDIRNCAVSFFDLKTAGIAPADPSRPAAAYQVGDSVGFSLSRQSRTAKSCSSPVTSISTAAAPSSSAVPERGTKWSGPRRSTYTTPSAMPTWFRSGRDTSLSSAPCWRIAAFDPAGVSNETNRARFDGQVGTWTRFLF